MIENILIIFFIFLLLHYLLFLYVVYSGLNKLKTATSINIPSGFVSIIIPFRNESENILNSYNSLSNQNYPKDNFEIIFVNDFSTDDSYKKLSDAISSSHIKVISVPDDYSVKAHKKRAIRFGIENSIGEFIVTTDADCIHSSDWLRIILNFFDEKTGFISGPVEFEEGKSLLSKLQKLEFAGLVITGAGLIGAGKPIICNAANIAYRKKVYEEVGGFTYQMNLSSGDDELLMQKISKDTKYKVKFANHRNAIVKTSSNKTISEFYQQRKRWASKGLFYNDKTLILKLILIYLFYISFPVQLLLGIFYSNILFMTLSLTIILKILFEFFVLKKGIKLLFNKKILNIFLLAEIVQIPYIIIAGISGAFGNYIWKNRKINR
ncbi:MAG: glycosyltransferase [Ignavibacteriaceae bacterium]|nr:glycosyltransferase [Ignavibacteriaceae bacterium]